ncbi:hypothetical protein [Streptomyces spiralis]|uniref:hypothetical protein n=1 Tax=Streptomyces spiralis TaxID=66376 RepID=UPI003687BDF9
MTVVLLPPVTSAPAECHDGAEALTEGPRFVRTRGMSRWHRPRSGVRYSDGHTAYDLWCGYGVGGSHRAGAFLTADEPAPGESVCGTCEGRAAGAGQEQASPTGRQLLFSPRHIDPPKNCPGSRSSELFEELPGGRAGRCLACRDVHPLRAMGGPYNSRYAITQHPPGPGLVGPCPFHRWRQLIARDGRAVCACGREVAQ